MTTPAIPADTAVNASRTIARRAHSKEDLTDLLGALGLPNDEDTVVALLPLLPEPTAEPTHNGDTTSMNPDPQKKTNAFDAMAVSMHNNGDTIDAIRAATGLTEDELASLGIDCKAQPEPGQDAPTPAIDDIEALLHWAEQHPTKSVQARAGRVRADLARLAEQQTTERAVADAEADVAKLRAELARAEDNLRAAKGPRGQKPGATVTGIGTARPAPAGTTREELRRIREWARANGHTVADRGLIPRPVREAYDAAHPAQLIQAS